MEHLEAKEATLNQILISYAPPQPPATQGKSKLYFVSMFEPYYNCSYAWELLVCACVLFLFICLNNLIVWFVWAIILTEYGCYFLMVVILLLLVLYNITLIYQTISNTVIVI